ncbi:hypothetical protein HDU76_001209 [Blyttiomyces sp. JEL0837]|nr:hypothetical protein HDU76_001209 [Blyttiomyces sp. JEL0837]
MIMIAATTTPAATDTTTTTSYHKPSPSTTSASCVSLWDRLPSEIKDQIFNATDIPTRFINNQPITSNEIAYNYAQIWIAVVKTNSWDLDLKVLSKYSFPMLEFGHDVVTSREAYLQLCKLTPGQHDGVQSLQRLFESPKFWRIEEPGIFAGADLLSSLHKNEIPKLLVNIPMRQYWTDMLVGLKDLDQLKLFFVAGSNGHFQLCKHLYSNIFNNEYNISATSEIPLSDLFAYIILYAAERGYLDIVQFILTNINISHIKNNIPSEIQPQSGPSVTLNKSVTTKAIYAAFKNGNLEIIKLLLPLPNNDPTLKAHDKFMFSAVKHLHVIEFLLSEVPGVNVNACALAALNNAVLGGAELETVRYLVSEYQGNMDVNEAIKMAAQQYRYPIVKFLALHGAVNLDVINRYVLTKVAANGDLELLKALVQSPGVDPTASDNAALIEASFHGHLAVVQFLLTLPGVDATAQNNKAFRVAATGGQLIIIQYLLTVPGVDPTACGNEAIGSAVMFGHEEVAKVLLALPGVKKPSSERFLDQCFDLVSSLKGLRVLLRYSGVDGAAITTKYLPRVVSKTGVKLHMVKPLVEFPGVDVTFDNYSVARIASENRKADIVKYLMDLPNIDKAAMRNSAVAGAASTGDLEFVKLLLEVPEVAASSDKSMAIKMSAKKGHVEIMNLLLKVPGVRDPEGYSRFLCIEG